MLNNKRITILSDSFIDDEKVATFGAVITVDDLELTMSGRYLNKDYCKLYRDIVRADQAEFEDYAYAVQDKLKA